MILHNGWFKPKGGKRYHYHVKSDYSLCSMAVCRLGDKLAPPDHPNDRPDNCKVCKGKLEYAAKYRGVR